MQHKDPEPGWAMSTILFWGLVVLIALYFWGVKDHKPEKIEPVNIDLSKCTIVKVEPIGKTYECNDIDIFHGKTVEF